MRCISVVIPIWNRAKSVDRAIDSALSQQLPAGFIIEVLVVDDGSTDQPEQALARFGDRIKLIKHPHNLGAAAARNTGAHAATGEYVAFLDSDDVWLPEKFFRQIAFMESHAFAASCTAYLLARRADDVIVSPGYRTGSLGLSDLVWGCFVSPGSTLMCRADVFSEVGELDSSLKRLEDWDWLLRFAMSGRSLGFLAEPLAHIEPSTGVSQSAVLEALEKIRARHVAKLAPADRRHFLAAYHLERAAAMSRSGSRAGAIADLLQSWMHAPLRHRALAAVIHNCFAAARRI